MKWKRLKYSWDKKQKYFKEKVIDFKVDSKNQEMNWNETQDLKTRISITLQLKRDFRQIKGTVCYVSYYWDGTALAIRAPVCGTFWMSYKNWLLFANQFLTEFFNQFWSQKMLFLVKKYFESRREVKIFNLFLLSLNIHKAFGFSSLIWLFCAINALEMSAYIQ